jgi:hypothetical protein
MSCWLPVAFLLDSMRHSLVDSLAVEIRLGPWPNTFSRPMFTVFLAPKIVSLAFTRRRYNNGQIDTGSPGAGRAKLRVG